METELVATDLEMPSRIKQNYLRDKAMIEQWEQEKEFKKRYEVIKRNIETCREARPVSNENLRDAQAVEWFSKLKQDIEKKIQTVNDRYSGLITGEEQKRKLFLEQSENRLERYKQQQDSELTVFQQKLQFIQSRLQTAQERTKQSCKKSKEELRCMKELQQLIETAKLSVAISSEKLFPGFETLLEIPPYTPPPGKKEGDIPQKSLEEETPLETGNQKSGKQPVRQDSIQTVETVKLQKQSSTDEVVMPYPDGTEKVFQYGKRIPKTGSLKEAIAKQDTIHSGLPFQPVDYQEETPVQKPKIIVKTIRRAASTEETK